MVTIKLFGALRLKTGCKSIEADVSTVREGLEALAEATGLSYKELKQCITCINGAQVKLSAPLRSGDELTLFSPSGGG